jgi:hypothetical protein
MHWDCPSPSRYVRRPEPIGYIVCARLLRLIDYDTGYPIMTLFARQVPDAADNVLPSTGQSVQTITGM